jgi:hypothetical protein
MEPTAVKVSVTGDTILDVPVGTACVLACVVVLVSRGNSREVDVENEALGDRPLPEIDVWVDTAGLVLVLVKDPGEPRMVELATLGLLELELLELGLPDIGLLGLLEIELLELELLEVGEEEIGPTSELVG